MVLRFKKTGSASGRVAYKVGRGINEKRDNVVKIQAGGEHSSDASQ